MTVQAAFSVFSEGGTAGGRFNKAVPQRRVVGLNGSAQTEYFGLVVLV